MIFSLREGLRQDLLARGFPVTVDCGMPRPASRGPSRQRHSVVLSRDYEQGDLLVAAPGGNPDTLFARMVGYTITVFAFDPSAGALSWEHESEADKLIDALIVSIQDWVTAQKAWRWEYVSGRMLSASELYGDSAETTHTAGYQMQIRIGRAVNRLEYDGDLTYETADISSVNIDAEVSLDGDDYEEI